MEITRDAAQAYLAEVKASVRCGRYRIEQNPKRRDNTALMLKYVLDEAGEKDILLSLSADDFSEIRHNEHVGFEHELLYVFGKDVTLRERFGHGEKTVHLYIKINTLEDLFVIVISFHEQKYPLKYCFKES